MNNFSHFNVPLQGPFLHDDMISLPTLTKYLMQAVINSSPCPLNSVSKLPSSHSARDGIESLPLLLFSSVGACLPLLIASSIDGEKCKKCCFFAQNDYEILMTLCKKLLSLAPTLSQLSSFSTRFLPFSPNRWANSAAGTETKPSSVL